MATTAKIEGMDDFMRCMDASCDNVVKMAKIAMRDAGKETARMIRQKSPGRFRRLIGYKVTKGQRTDNAYALVGFFNKGKKKGSNAAIPDWFKAYWKNYGTLTRRDASHHFSSSVKGRTRYRRNNVGQPAELFFEQAIAGWEDKFMTAFANSLKKNEEKLYDR